ncbi:MAG: complex I NDUFA9 subunit family protein [Gammaproteobacteria bacterium]
MKRRDICILGGTGFVGGRIATRLANAEHHVKVLTRYREAHKELLVLPNLQLVQTNVHSQASLAREFADCDIVINLVGILNETRHQTFNTVHVELAGKVVAACKEAGVRRLLHMSALRADINGPSRYLRTKGEAESLVLNEKDLDVTVFRPSVIFGPGDSFVNRFAALLKVPSPIFMLPSPNARFAPVYVADVVSAFEKAVNDNETSGKTYDLAGPKVYSLKEIVSNIARALGLHRRIIGLGDTMSRMIARILGRLPGKPMSVDNYLSMKVHSITDQNGFAALDIKLESFEALLPLILAGDPEQVRLDQFRTESGRF